MPPKPAASKPASSKPPTTKGSPPKAAAPAKSPSKQPPSSAAAPKTTKLPAKPLGASRSKSPPKKKAGDAARQESEKVDPPPQIDPPKQEEPPAPAPPSPVLGVCRVRYNHYNEEFDLVDGKLDFEEVDEKYCISFVFKGNWTIKLDGPGNNELRPDGGALQKTVDDEGDPKVIGTFSGLMPDEQYVIIVEEDPALADAPRTTYTATSTMQGRANCDDGDGLMMGEDKASCSCLYGNPCASAYSALDANAIQTLCELSAKKSSIPMHSETWRAIFNKSTSFSDCKDWKNRFEVSKKNGWKGFS